MRAQSLRFFGGTKRCPFLLSSATLHFSNRRTASRDGYCPAGHHDRRTDWTISAVKPFHPKPTIGIALPVRSLHPSGDKLAKCRLGELVGLLGISSVQEGDVAGGTAWGIAQTSESIRSSVCGTRMTVMPRHCVRRHLMGGKDEQVTDRPELALKPCPAARYSAPRRPTGTDILALSAQRLRFKPDQAAPLPAGLHADEIDRHPVDKGSSRQSRDVGCVVVPCRLVSRTMDVHETMRGSGAASLPPLVASSGLRLTASPAACVGPRAQERCGKEILACAS